MNRVLTYLQPSECCECCRRREREAELEAIAEHLSSVLTSGLFRVEAFDGEVHLSILFAWAIDNPDDARPELLALFAEIEEQLSEDAARLRHGGEAVA